jgi:hypothetical protein
MIRITLTNAIPQPGHEPVPLAFRTGVAPGVFSTDTATETVEFAAPIDADVDPASWLAVELVLAAVTLLCDPPAEDCQICAEFARGHLFMLAGADGLSGAWALVEGVGRHVTRRATVRASLPGMTAPAGSAK